MMLEKPEILKNTSHWQTEIERLSALAKEGGEDIQRQLKRAKLNLEGEERVLNELLKLNMPMHILRDVNINYAGQSSRIDFMVFTRKMAFIITCADILGNVEIAPDGGVICEHDGERTTVYPAKTNAQHLRLIRKVKRDEMKGMSKFFQRIMHFDNWYKTLIVMTDPNATFSDANGPKNFEKIVRVDLLRAHIKNVYNESSVYLSDDKELSEWSEQFLQMHRE